MHDFWAYQGPAMQNQMINFLKNVTIIGGLLTIAAVGAGPFSVDAHFGRDAAAERRNAQPAAGGVGRQVA
jgi:uncharacterized membrane protein YphA (DoxX/SURF4 family)